MSRLFELLARNLGISRTAASRLIEEGRVTDVLGTAYHDRKVIPEAGTASVFEPQSPPAVLVDGNRVSLWSSAVLLLHKPTGVVTAVRDRVHATAYDLLREAPLFPELRAVGRLDLDTSGLLLWTTEGALIQRMTHPKRRVPRTYQAALARNFAPLSANLILDDGHRPEVVALEPLTPSAAHPALIIPEGTTTLATVTIIGGAYHEVRRLFAALGSHVLGLCRTGFGPYTLPPELPPGAWQMVPAPAEPSLGRLPGR